MSSQCSIVIEDAWTEVTNKGTGPNHVAFVLDNPQYHIRVSEPCQVTITLEARQLVNFHIFKHSEDTLKRKLIAQPSDLVFPQVLGQEFEWMKKEATVQLDSTRVPYVIIPGTWASNIAMQYTLRFNSTKPIIVEKSEDWKNIKFSQKDWYYRSFNCQLFLANNPQYKLTVNRDTDVYLHARLRSHARVLAFEAQPDITHRIVAFDQEKLISPQDRNRNTLVPSDFTWDAHTTKLHAEAGKAYVLTPCSWNHGQTLDFEIQVSYPDDASIELVELPAWNLISSVEDVCPPTGSVWSNEFYRFLSTNVQYRITNPKRCRAYIALTTTPGAGIWIYKTKVINRLNIDAPDMQVGHHSAYASAGYDLQLEETDDSYIVVISVTKSDPYTLYLYSPDEASMKLEKIDSREELIAREQAKDSTSVSEYIQEKYKPIGDILFEKDPIDEIIGMCETDGKMFKDSIFGTDDSAVFHHKSHAKYISYNRFLRLAQLYNEPKIYPDGDTTADEVLQGIFPHCYMTSAVTCIATRPDITKSMIRPATYNKWGVYSVRVYINNRPYYMVIDDYIPSIESIAFMHSKQHAYVSLIEKAMAKLCGRYQCLDGAYVSNADEYADLGPARVLSRTGAPGSNELKVFSTFTNSFTSLERYHLVYNVPDGREILWKKLKKFMKNRWLVELYPPVNHEYNVKFHTPSLLATVEHSGFRLIKLRNPWGKADLWDGEWSDTSDMWDKYPELKEICKPEAKDDGITWVSYDHIIDATENTAVKTWEGMYIYFCRIFDNLFQHTFASTIHRDSTQVVGHQSYLPNDQYLLTVTTRTCIQMHLAERDNRIWKSDSGFVPSYLDVYKIEGGKPTSKLTLFPAKHAVSEIIVGYAVVQDLYLDPDAFYVVIPCIAARNSNPDPPEIWHYVLNIYSDNEMTVSRIE